VKKIAVFLVLSLAVFLFSGCERKSSVSVTTASSTPIPEELQGSSDTSPTATTSQTTDSSSQNEFVIDSATIDNTFQQNYDVALDDAQKSLKSGVKYCGAKVTFYGATLTESSKQSFVFYSDLFSADYYWVVTLNGYQANQKTRAFVPKRDMVNEIKCMTNTGPAPSTFTGEYKQLTKSDKFKNIDPGTIAETTIETTNANWNITIINNIGESALVQTLGPSATSSGSTSDNQTPSE